MPQRLFKARAKKIAPKTPAAHETREVVLVGTYKVLFAGVRCFRVGLERKAA